MSSYTVFADDLHRFAPRRGLSLTDAFAWVLAASRSDHVFERRPDGHALIIWDDALQTFAPRQITTTFRNDRDARTVLMLKAVVSGLNGFRALPDEVFREQLRHAVKDIEGEEIFAS